MNRNQCLFCGSIDYQQKMVEYLYRYQHHYMIFRDVPADVCLHCGMRYYTAEVIMEIEQRFFAVLQQQVSPTHSTMVPIETFAYV